MKRHVVGVMMLAGFASAAQSEEIKATKKSGGQQIIDTLYGNVEGRVQTYQYNDAQGNTQGSRDLAFRPKLGTKLLNETLDINFTAPIVNKQQSAVSKDARPEVESTLTLYDTPRLGVELYYFSYMQTKDAKYEGYADLDITFKRKFDNLSFGTVDLSLLVEPEASLTTERKDPNVARREREDGLTLSASDPATAGEQRETDKNLNIWPSISIAPSAIPGLTTSFGAIFSNTYSARYVDKITDAGESKLEKDGYNITRSSQVRYTVKYQIKEGLHVYNQLRQNFDGYAESSYKDMRLDNRTGIVMSLF